MPELMTIRLELSRFSGKDVDFVLRLLNDPAFLHYIGDKGVRDADSALNYILSGPVASYEQHGFGLYMVCLKDSGEPVGMCGLLKRESLEDVDIGFAFLPEYHSQGYAFEAAAAVMQQGRAQFGLSRIVAVTSADNKRSARLLQRLGMHFEGMMSFPGSREELRLFAWNEGDKAT
jgi:RimJ/RimL family protein N-acetyltransferase